ncbi:MAG TPA: TetR/AcrR family transcriptional regulator [Egibacteraceae bacterium]|nr:TetR/AcrR family transcriptional regulator [Egibacteraceae bacterium]
MTDSSPAGDGADRTVALTRGARTAARLRRAASEAFAELGWQGTRVEDIVQRAGVSHGTFYTYYENKSAVLADLVRSTQQDLASLAEAPWEADDVRGALTRVIGGFLDVYKRDSVTIRTWLDAANDEPVFSELYRESREMFIARVGDYVSKAVAVSGRHAGPPPHIVASALAAMVEHFAYCWAVLGESHERNDAVDALVHVWGSALNSLAGFRIVRPE